MHDLNEGLSFEALLGALKALDSETLIRIYFEPETWRFYILHNAELTILVPQGSMLVSSGRPVNF